MNNLLKGIMAGCGTTPKSNTGMFFCVHTNTIPTELEDCSYKELTQEQIEQKVQTSKEDLRGVKSLMIHLKYTDLLIQRLDRFIIKALEEQVSDKEQELFEKDRHIVQLENELEDVCEKLFLEANLR